MRRALVIAVHHGYLSAVHLHAVAREHIDDQELLVWAGFDLLRESSSKSVDFSNRGIDQTSDILEREFRESSLDQVPITIDLHEVLDSLLNDD